MPSLETILGALKSAAAIAKSVMEIGQDVAPIAAVIIDFAAKGENATEADIEALQKQSAAWEEEILAADPGDGNPPGQA